MFVEESKFILTDENVAEAGRKAGELYKQVIRKKRQYPADRTVLAAEEILQHFQSTYGKDAECTMRCSSFLGSGHIDFLTQGVSNNPLAIESEELQYSRKILEMYGVAPSYAYHNRSNQNVVTLKMAMKPAEKTLVKGVIAALILAIIARLILGLFPPDTIAYIRDDIVNLVFTKMTTIIGEVATILVFLSVVTGITGIGNTAALGKMGKQLVKDAGITYLFSGIVLAFLGVLLYPIVSAAASGANVFGQLLQLVLDMIPDNMLECIVVDNDLQVIVMAIFVGAVLLSLGKKATKVNDALSLLSEVVNKMMTVICKLLPAIVFFGILNMLLGDMSQIARVYKAVIIFVVVAACVIIFLLIKVKVNTGLSPLSLFKYQAPTALINLSTGSQIASMGENIICCRDKFGIDKHFTDFALPLSIVAYMPCGTGFLGCAVYGLADITGMPMDVNFIIKLAIMAIVVAIAAPPIPGNAFIVLPIMLSGCGVPMTYYSLAIVLGTVLGYLCPLLNGYCMQLEMLVVANKLGMVDRSRLGIKTKEKS